MAVRFEGVAESEMRARLAEAWRSVVPDIPLDLKSAEDSLDKYYAPDRIRSRLIGIAAAGAGLIGCLGLYGMAAFGASRRMLEGQASNHYYAIDARGTDPVLTEQRTKAAILAAHNSAVGTSVQAHAEQMKRMPQR